jgi:cell division protein FtsN
MKWLVFMLLLLNGGFFAWQYYTAHGKPGQEIAADSQGKYDPLTLISELGPEQRKALGVTPKDGEADMAAKKPGDSEQMVEHPAQTPSHGKMAQAEPKPESKPESKSETPPPAAKAQTAPAAEKPKQEMPANLPHCYSLGPMGNQKMVKQVKLRVTSMGLTVQRVRNEVEKVPTNWIYLGPYKSESEAKRAVSRLHAKGVKDTQIINKGANNHIVSVGLFSTQAGADERLKRLQDAGFTPSVSKVTAKKSHYWLDVSYNGGKAVDKKILNDMVRGIRGAGVKEMACKPR